MRNIFVLLYHQTQGYIGQISTSSQSFGFCLPALVEHVTRTVGQFRRDQTLAADLPTVFGA